MKFCILFRMLDLLKALWPLFLLIIAMGVIVFVVKTLKSATNQDTEDSPDLPEFPYTLKPSLLSKGELAFYEALKIAVNNRCQIMAKVGLFEIVEIKDAVNRQRAFNKIRSKQIDFVLCRHNTFEILAAIELNDKTHDKPNRRTRDEFLEAAFKSANLPFLIFPARSNYIASEIAEQIEFRLSAAASRT